MVDETLETQATGLSDMEAEHARQYELLAETERLLEASDVEGARAVAAKLLDYSEAHFGSEQVIMRLHAYPGYQAHLREHGDLLNGLRQLIAGLDGKHAALGAGAIRRWLTAHIHHADREFIEFLQRSPLTAE
jgi:hemerythrin